MYLSYIKNTQIFLLLFLLLLLLLQICSFIKWYVYTELLFFLTCSFQNLFILKLILEMLVFFYFIKKAERRTSTTTDRPTHTIDINRKKTE